MATTTKYGELSISGDNASYTLTLSGMSTSKRYHVFVADLNASGKADYYYCRRSSTGSSSSWTYSGSSSATYAKYQRLVQVYQTDSATPFNVGSKYTSDEITSGLSGTGWTVIASEYIPAASTSSTFYYQYQYIKPDGSILETSNIYAKDATLQTTSISVTLSDIPQPTNTDYVKTGSYTFVAHCSINLEDDYASCSSTSTSDPSIIGVKVQFNKKIFYYQYQYIKPDGSVLETSNIYAKGATLQTTSITVKLSDIPQPSSSGYTKTGSYTVVAHCSINLEDGCASCSSTSTSDPSIIGVKVRPAIKIFYYQYRYLTPNGRTIKDSNIYAQDATYFDSRISVRLADIPGPNVGRWEKSGQYSNVAHCSFDMEGGYALCSSTSTADPSIIGVYCEQEPISRFTWLGSDPQDNAAFASGKYISDAITANGWNAMYAKIKELAEATGGQFDYDAVSKGDQITATEFNYMRLGIINLPWHGSLPNAVAADMPIFADYFNGSVSLKSALNASIDEFNNQ